MPQVPCRLCGPLGRACRSLGPNVSHIFNRQLLIGPLLRTGGTDKGKMPMCAQGALGTLEKAFSIQPGSRSACWGGFSQGPVREPGLEEGLGISSERKEVTQRERSSERQQVGKWCATSGERHRSVELHARIHSDTGREVGG